MVILYLFLVIIIFKLLFCIFENSAISQNSENFGQNADFALRAIQAGDISIFLYRVRYLADAPMRRNHDPVTIFKSGRGLGCKGRCCGFDHHWWNCSANVRMCKFITRNALTHSPSPNIPSVGIEPWSTALQSALLTS